MPQLAMPPLSELARKKSSPDEVTRYMCQRSFAEFIREFWEEVPGAGQIMWNWHMDFLAEEWQVAAERVMRGERKAYDLVANVCFGTSKSTICSIMFPPWTWIRMPTFRHLNATHTHSLVMDFAFKSRALMSSDKFKRLFPEIVLTRDSGEIYSNTEGGEVRACTIGGKTPTGFHAHFL